MCEQIDVRTLEEGCWGALGGWRRASHLEWGEGIGDQGWCP